MRSPRRPHAGPTIAPASVGPVNAQRIIDGDECRFRAIDSLATDRRVKTNPPAKFPSSTATRTCHLLKVAGGGGRRTSLLGFDNVSESGASTIPPTVLADDLARRALKLVIFTSPGAHR